MMLPKPEHNLIRACNRSRCSLCWHFLWKKLPRQMTCQLSVKDISRWRLTGDCYRKTNYN